jgi:hypothetical protein
VPDHAGNASQEEPEPVWFVLEILCDGLKNL